MGAYFFNNIIVFGNRVIFNGIHNIFGITQVERVVVRIGIYITPPIADGEFERIGRERIPGAILGIGCDRRRAGSWTDQGCTGYALGTNRFVSLGLQPFTSPQLEKACA